MYITEQEAYSLYLKEGWDDVMPFDDNAEDNYCDYLARRGVIVIDPDIDN